jgi:hypothetical protein
MSRRSETSHRSPKRLKLRLFFGEERPPLTLVRQTIDTAASASN